METSAAVVAAVFCSRAEVQDMLQAALWLQQLGQHQHDQPLQGAIIGLAQESSRMCGLQRMRLLLVKHSSTTLADNGLLQDSSTQLTCCGSSAAGQDVVVTLEALVEQLPPAISADEATYCATSSISSACWQSAVKQMQREAPLLCTEQQVGRAMLRLALYHHAYQLLQPVQQLLATHGHSFSSLAPLLQYVAAASCSDQNNTALLPTLQQHLQGVDRQVAPYLLQTLSAVQQLLQQFGAPVPEEVMQQVQSVWAVPASFTPASSAPPAAGAVPPAAAAAGGTTPNGLPPAPAGADPAPAGAHPAPAAAAAGATEPGGLPALQLNTSSSKRTAPAASAAQLTVAKRARHMQQLPPQQVLQEVHVEAGDRTLAGRDEQQQQLQHQQQHQHQQQLQYHQQQGSVPHRTTEQQWVAGTAEQQQVGSTAVQHACNHLQEGSSSEQLLQGLQDDNSSEEQRDTSRCNTAAAQGQQVAAARHAGPAADLCARQHGVVLPDCVALLLAEAAAALRAAHGHNCVPLEAWMTVGSGAALASRLGGSVFAAAAFLQRWPQVFVLRRVNQGGQGSTGSGCRSGAAAVVGLRHGAELWLLHSGHCLQLVNEFRAALVRAAMCSSAPSTTGAAPSLNVQLAIRLMPRQLAPYRQLYTKFGAFLEAAGLLQIFKVDKNGSQLVLRTQTSPGMLPCW